MRSFSENAPSDKTIQRIKTRVLCNCVVSWKLTQPLTPTKNDICIDGYFIVDTILSVSHQRTFGGSYAPAFTVVWYIRSYVSWRTLSEEDRRREISLERILPVALRDENKSLSQLILDVRTLFHAQIGSNLARRYWLCRNFPDMSCFLKDTKELHCFRVVTLP